MTNETKEIEELIQKSKFSIDYHERELKKEKILFNGLTLYLETLNKKKKT